MVDRAAMAGLGQRSRAQVCREATRSRILTSLIDRRRELAGVHRPADVFVEAVLWGA